jgi:hypothetical protein
MPIKNSMWSFMLDENLITALIAVGLIILLIIGYHDQRRRTERRRRRQLVLVEAISIDKHLSKFVIPALEFLAEGITQPAHGGFPALVNASAAQVYLKEAFHSCRCAAVASISMNIVFFDEAVAVEQAQALLPLCRALLKTAELHLAGYADGQLSMGEDNDDWQDMHEEALAAAVVSLRCALKDCSVQESSYYSELDQAQD